VTKPVMAAWLLSWYSPWTWPVPPRGRPLCDGVPRDRRHGRERLTSSRPANGSAQHGFVIRDRRSPGRGGCRGFRTGDPLGGGEYDRPIRLNSDQSPEVPRRHASPLTPLCLSAPPANSCARGHNRGKSNQPEGEQYENANSRGQNCDPWNLALYVTFYRATAVSGARSRQWESGQSC
jgi:hypothetical protein